MAQNDGRLTQLQLRLHEVDLLARDLRYGIVDGDKSNATDLTGGTIRIAIVQWLQCCQARQPHLIVDRLVGVMHIVVARGIHGRHAEFLNLLDDKFHRGR